MPLIKATFQNQISFKEFYKISEEDNELTKRSNQLMLDLIEKINESFDYY